jgi:hypothetical protein
MARVSQQAIIDVWERQGGVCAICGEPLDESAYEAHHMRRVKDGGSDAAENMVLLCDRDEHEYVHGGNFRKEIETTPDQYPYFDGKSRTFEYEEIIKSEKEEPVDDSSVDEGDESIDDSYNEGGDE